MGLNALYRWLIFLVLLMGVISCGKDSACFKSTGEIIKEQRKISSDVRSIVTANNIDIVITQSNDARLTLEGGKNLLPYINTTVSGNELTISSDNRCSMFRDYDIPITIYLSIPDLRRIDYTGQGNITSTNILNFSDFTIETNKGTGSINLQLHSTNIALFQHTGPADFTLSGSTDNLYVYSGGKGWFFLNHLVANNVHTNNDGSGDMLVRVNNTLLVELTFLGNIDYYGNPNVTVSKHSGNGELRKK